MNKLIKTIILCLLVTTMTKPFPALAVTGAQLPKACVADKNLIRNAVQLSRVERLASNEFRVYWDLESSLGSPVHSLQPEVGGQFYVVRCMPTGRWEVVGQGALEGINGTLAEAKVTAGGQSDEKTIVANAIQTGNLYPRPMAGDLIAPTKPIVEQRIAINRRFEFPIAQLFELGSQNMQTYNLSDEGREKIRLAMESFQNAKGRLLVEGFIHRAGSRDDLQIESQMRATSVAQFVRREFGIADNQVVAIGLGASSYETGFNVVAKWPAATVDEGIVIRVLND